MSKYRFSHSSIYINGTDIPQNKLNIKSSKEIHEVENFLLLEAYEKFSNQINFASLLDETYFINLHKNTFEPLYTFAGVYRDVNMNKGESQFFLAQYLPTESKRIFKELEGENYLADIKEGDII